MAHYDVTKGTANSFKNTFRRMTTPLRQVFFTRSNHSFLCSEASLQARSYCQTKHFWLDVNIRLNDLLCGLFVY